MDEARAAYKQILAKPFRFDKREEVLANGNSMNVFPADSAAQRDIRRKRLKYLVLEAFTELQEQRAESKPGTDLHNSTDADLEKKAGEKVGKQADRDIARLMEINRDETKTICYRRRTHRGSFPGAAGAAVPDRRSARPRRYWNVANPSIFLYGAVKNSCTSVLNCSLLNTGMECPELGTIHR